MGRRGKFIRDIMRGRDRPRDKKLGSYPSQYWQRRYHNLYEKLKKMSP